jgi:hypothetical protein
VLSFPKIQLLIASVSLSNSSFISFRALSLLTMSVARFNCEAFDSVTKGAHDALKTCAEGKLPVSVIGLTLHPLISASVSILFLFFILRDRDSSNLLLQESLMAFLDKSPAAAGKEAHQQRVFHARNCFNGFKNTCDASYVQPEVYGTLTKFCAAIQVECGRSSNPKIPNNTPVCAGTPANTKGVSKCPAAMTSGGKVSSLNFLILFSYNR